VMLVSEKEIHYLHRIIDELDHPIKEYFGVNNMFV
jgi:hypothetical protein